MGGEQPVLPGLSVPLVLRVPDAELLPAALTLCGRDGVLKL